MGFGLVLIHSHFFPKLVSFKALFHLLQLIYFPFKISFPVLVTVSKDPFNLQLGILADNSLYFQTLSGHKYYLKSVDIFQLITFLKAIFEQLILLEIYSKFPRDITDSILA